MGGYQAGVTKCVSGTREMDLLTREGGASREGFLSVPMA